MARTFQVLSREPMLRPRIYRRVSVEPLTPAEVCALIPTYHPPYEGVDVELLLLIDDHFAHGNLRHWAAFTRGQGCVGCTIPMTITPACGIWPRCHRPTRVPAGGTLTLFRRRIGIRSA